MKVIRGTRAPALAAACAMLLLGAGAADSPEAPLVLLVRFSSAPVVAGGVDGCPALAGSTFDPRELCSTDLGAGWVPVGAEDVHVCPPGPSALGAALSSSALNVNERIITEADPAAAIALVRARTSCAVASRLFGESRKLPAIAIAGTTDEAQLVIDLPGLTAGVTTLIAMGNVVISVGVSDDEGVPDSATVLRIVNLAIHRFQNPRSSGGPFPPVMVPTSAIPSVP
jgi:hypothetical protein